MAEVADATGHTGVGICGNGAFIYDMHDEVVVELFGMSGEVAIDAVDRVREVLPTSAFAVESLAGFSYEPALQAALGHPRADDDWSDPWTARQVTSPSCWCATTSLPGDVMLERAAPALSGVVEVTHSDANDSLLELSALGVTQGHDVGQARGAVGDRAA